jgi:hypothetical protein
VNRFWMETLLGSFHRHSIVSTTSPFAVASCWASRFRKRSGQSLFQSHR